MTLSELTSKIEKWREERTSERGRIPESIWGEAIRLSKIHGVTIVAKSLKLQSTDLKKKVENSKTKSIHSVKKESLFTDLSVPHILQDPKRSLEIEVEGIKISIFR